jgi:hypothetical protein
MAAYKNREYPVVSDGFVQDGDYHVRILYEYDHQTRPHPLLV